MGRLDGKVALVTGASRGTGEATARRFVAEGAKVVLGDIRDDLGKTVAADLGPDAVYTRLDITDEMAWTRATDLACERYGKLDVLINNAAILHIAPIARTTLDDWNRVIQVNQTGTFLGIRAAIEPMRAAGGGSIVNISSIDGLEGMNGVSAYAASKWAIRGLAKCAALELGRLGIRVNTVCPAGGSLEMTAPWRLPDADASSYGENRPIPRPAELGEIVSMILYLASDESSFCSGGDYPVDGGHSCGSFVPGIPSL